MKQLIKNFIPYSAQLPAADLLRQHLAEKPFTEPMSLEAQSTGFIPVPDADDTVVEFEGGLAFAVRHDVKVVPASAVKAELAKRVEQVAMTQGFKPGRAQIKELKEQVQTSLLAKAMCRSTVVQCFYSLAGNHLFVATSSRAMADTITSLLIHAVGSIKTQTIHVSDIKHGLTTRLGAWLDGDHEIFGDFDPADEIALRRQAERLSIRMPSLDNAEQALREAMTAGFQVDAIRFTFGETASFRLTSDFHFKGIAFEASPAETDGETTVEDAWRHEAAVELLTLTRAVQSLCDLMGYKAPATENEAAA